MTAVWNAGALPWMEPFVLLALADWADDAGGSIYPSIPTVSRKTRLGERTVRRTFRAVESLGVLVKVRAARQHRAAEYRIDLSRLASLTPASVAALNSRPATQSIQGGHAGPLYVRNHQEPSEPTDKISSCSNGNDGEPTAAEIATVAKALGLSHSSARAEVIRRRGTVRIGELLRNGAHA